MAKWPGASAHPGSRLGETVELLAGCHRRDLQKLAELKGRARCLFLYRCRQHHSENPGMSYTIVCITSEGLCGRCSNLFSYCRLRHL